LEPIKLLSFLGFTGTKYQGVVSFQGDLEGPRNRLLASPDFTSCSLKVGKF